MKIVKNAAIAALLSCSLLTPVSPALAAQQAWTAEQTASYPNPQAVCDEQLKPSPQSGFLSEVQNSVTTTVYGPDIPDATSYKQVPTGTPTYTNVFLDGSLYRNGGSPNVWGGGTATINYPSSDLYYHTTHTVTRRTTFDCVPYKYVGDDKLVDPYGLSSTGNVKDEAQGTEAGADYIDHNGGPVSISGQTIATLVCISPNNTTKGKPGTWVGKHGVTDAQCNLWQTNGAFNNLNPVPSYNSPDSYIP